MIFKSWMIEIQNISKQGLKKGDLKQDFTAILWPPLPHLDFHGTQTRSHASAGASFVLCWHHLSHEFCTTFNPARWRDFRKHHPFDRLWAYHVYIVEIWTKIDSIEVEFVSWSTKIIAMSLLISAIQLFRWTWSSCLEKNVCSIMKRPVILKTCQILLYWDCIPAHAWNTDPSFEMQICLIETPWKNPNKGHCSNYIESRAGVLLVVTVVTISASSCDSCGARAHHTSQRLHGWKSSGARSPTLSLLEASDQQLKTRSPKSWRWQLQFFFKLYSKRGSAFLLVAKLQSSSPPFANVRLLLHCWQRIWIEKFWELQKSSFLDSIGVLVGAPVIAQ